jgi:hypothetical protein
MVGHDVAPMVCLYEKIVIKLSKPDVGQTFSCISWTLGRFEVSRIFLQRFKSCEKADSILKCLIVKVSSESTNNWKKKYWKFVENHQPFIENNPNNYQRM